MNWRTSGNIFKIDVMKRFYFICTVALLTAVACNKDMPADVQGDGSVTLKAVVETDTKVNASINKDTRKVNFTWTAQDVIAVETSAGFENFTLAGQGGSADGSFTGNPSGEIGDVAVFPSILSPELDGTSLTVTLPAEYNGINLQTNALLLGSQAEGNIYFQHIGSLLLCSYGNVSSATKFVVSVPGKKINGAYTLDLSQDTPYIALEDTDVEAESKVAVKVAGNQNIVVFVPLPVGEYPQMSVWLENAAGEVIPGSLKTTTTSKTLSRKTVKEMPGVHVYNSYVINSLEELNAFNAGAKEDIQNLTINDPACTIPDGTPLADLKLRVNSIKGDFTIIGTQLTTTEHFFGEIGVTWGVFKPEGSIIFKDCSTLTNLNGMKTWTSIGGDLVFENCPNIATNWAPGQNCLQGITEVKGSVKLIGVQTQMAGITFNSLKKVGGDFHVEGCNGMFWNLDTMPLEEIGGSLIYRNNSKVNGLGGFGNVKSIGGTVTITGNGSENGGIQWTTNMGANMVGFDLVQGWITGGIISKDKVTCTNHQGTPVDFN